MNKWTRRFELNGSSARANEAADASHAHHYFAFLSYSHADSPEADWLHEELEQFRVPRSLAGKLTAHGVIPKRLSPIFRDRHELAAGQDLTDEIQAALSASRCLIVLCSPAAAKSKWTNAEIEYFKHVHPDGCVIAAIIAGDPLSVGEDNCFPAALTQRFDRRGRPTGRRTEPLAADLREKRDARRVGLLKIIAGILGLGLDDLVQRDQLRRHRRLAAITGGSLAGFIGASILAVTAIQARDEARDQRRQAESLVEFMVGDLKDKLEPIGRLDVLDGVGSRVLQYYGKQDTSQLSDQALAQRSKALTLMGQIARDRGNLDRADALYRAAYAGTAEAIRRSPNDPERIYEHAQNVFYIADIAYRRGRLSAAEAAFREYKALADQMVTLAPDSIKYRMEVQYAAANLGMALYDRRDFRGAIQQSKNALGTIEALSAADPKNDDYRTGRADALTLLADAQQADGRLSDALNSRQQYLGLLQHLPGNAADIRFRLIPAHRDLGRLYIDRGETAAGLEQLRAAISDGEALLAIEPANSKWLQSTEEARLELARALFDAGDIPQAAAQAASTCPAFERLVAQEPTVARRRAGLRDCLLLRTRLSLQSGADEQALGSAVHAVQIARTVNAADQNDARFGLAEALRVLGDARRDSGDADGARAAWTQAQALIPANVAEKPPEMREHAIILQRLGQTAEAERLLRRLSATGYRPQVQSRT